VPVRGPRHASPGPARPAVPGPGGAGAAVAAAGAVPRPTAVPGTGAVGAPARGRKAGRVKAGGGIIMGDLPGPAPARTP
ncbi:hypothetical protein ACFWYJ_34045, partial [Streptomyces albireticuli]